MTNNKRDVFMSPGAMVVGKRKTVMVAGLLLGLLATSGSYAAEPCEQDLGKEVGPISFRKLSAADAMSKTVEETRFRVINAGANTAYTISADDVSGPLHAVVDQFAKELNVEYRVRGCEIHLYTVGTAPKTKAYSLAVGQPVDEELNRWASSEGWKFTWLPDRSWRVYAPTTLEAESASEAVTRVVGYLRAEGKPVRLKMYSGNKVMEVESTDIRGN